METLAAYTWMTANFICMLLIIWIGRHTRKVYHMLYVILHLCAGLWGMTVVAINIPVIREINAVWLPLIGGVAAVVGAVLRLKEILKQEHSK